MKNLNKEYKALVLDNHNSIQKFNKKISGILLKLLPTNKTNVSGIKNIFGDYVTGISSKRVNLRFAVTKLSYTQNVIDETLFYDFSIETKLKLIEQLQK